MRKAVLFGLAATLMTLAPLAAAEPRTVELALRNGEVVADKRVVRVRQGDDVVLQWTTDRPLTVHLHGYDIERDLSPGTTVSMRFTARATGRFPIEAHARGHDRERTVLYLEVHPR